MASMDRFWTKVEKTDGCWNWTACTHQGYGRFNHNGSAVLAHRLSYELLVGPVPTGLTLDHLCRNRKCVNPAHLEPVTRGENVLRGESLQAQNARKTHCPRGHLLSGENMSLKGSYRRCLSCHREEERLRRLRNKSLAQASA